MPPAPEVYYEPTGKEIQPKPVGEEDGEIVFQYNPTSAVNYFSRSAVGGNRVLVAGTTGGGTPSGSGKHSLRFESRFESGNLAKAVKITDTYYELSLRSDLYTNRHVQWFYFMVENMRKGIVYRLSIVNLAKDDSLYNSGMKPVLYSTKDAFLRKIGWRRCGLNIVYYKNEAQTGEDDQSATYTLTFNIEFPHDYDCVYLAHSYPYTYTDLQEYLVKLQNHPIKSGYTKLRLLCKSLAGNNVYYLTVTEPSTAEENALPKKKKAVVITARVHPGETPSSWMMKGVMDFITGDSKQAKELREKFIFKLIPMLNPDGVIVGNSRCSLTGRDLNRQYRTVIRETYPPVWHTKLMVRRLIEECGGVAMYCDFHAHSVKHNVFIYGCENKRSPETKLQEQVFPLMLHKNTADKFSFENCKFRIQRSKEGTGRVVMWMMGVANSYTMEASFAGSTLGTRHYTHFTTQDYEHMGRSFCETLLDYVDEAPSKEKLRAKIIQRLQKGGSSADEPANIDLSDYTSDEGDASDTSDASKDRPGEEESFPTAPPPSPASSDEKVNRHRSKEHAGGSPKPHRSVIMYSPPIPRQIMQIPRAMLDLESGDLGGGALAGSSDDWTSKSTPQLPRKKHHQQQMAERSPSPVLKAEKTDMPPELRVSSAQQGCDQQAHHHHPSAYDRLAEYVKGHSDGEQRTSWAQRGGHRRQPDEQEEQRNQLQGRTSERYLSPLKHSRQNGLVGADDFCGDTRLLLRRSVWTVFPRENEQEPALQVTWDLTVAQTQEQLLRSCSEKLHELKKFQKCKWWKKNRTEQLVDVEDPTSGGDSVHRQKKKIKRKTSKIKRKEVSVQDEKLNNSSLRIKPLRAEEPDKLYDTEWTSNNINNNSKRRTVTGKSSGATRKFRKGAIVATAVQSRPHSAGYLSGEESGDRQQEGVSVTNNGKKKRKKRKLQNIQKQVKSVICLVTKSDGKKKTK